MRKKLQWTKPLLESLERSISTKGEPQGSGLCGPGGSAAACDNGGSANITNPS
jgi:hypothetical protein